MVRRYLTPLMLALAAGDLVTGVVAFVAVSLMRFPYGDWAVVWRQLEIDPALFAAATAASWVFFLWILGAYRFRVGLSARGDVGPIVYAACLQLVFTFATLFLLHKDAVSRTFLIALGIALASVTILSRWVIREAFISLRTHGHGVRYALIVGTGEDAQSWADLLERHRELGVRVIGHLGDDGEAASALTRPVLGSIFQMQSILADRVVDEVGIVLAPGSWEMLNAIISVALETGAVVRIPTWDNPLMLPGARIDETDGVRVLSFVRGPERHMALAVKRGMDIVGAVVGLVLLSPLFVAIALAIRARDGSPVFFRQVRVGVNGRPFTMVKFRTMTRDADDRLPELLHKNEMTGSLFKLTDDPRITRTGSVLRRTSGDELPQLWNVLRGHMSLVGPRPPLPREMETYDLWHRRRLSMRPGMTGLQQVEARRDPEFDRWVELDLAYIDQWSLMLDMKIMVRTIPAVIAANGR